MGKTFTGGTTKVGEESLLQGNQQRFLSQFLSQLGPDAISALQGVISPGNTQDVFQQSYVDPAMMALNQEILPAIQERFIDMGAGSSSALNQALAQAAANTATQIGSQYGQFQQNQNQQILQGFGLMQPYTTGQFRQPIYEQSQGLLGPLIGAGATLGAAYLGSGSGASSGASAGKK